MKTNSCSALGTLHTELSVGVLHCRCRNPEEIEIVSQAQLLLRCGTFKNLVSMGFYYRCMVVLLLLSWHPFIDAIKLVIFMIVSLALALALVATKIPSLSRRISFYSLSRARSLAHTLICPFTLMFAIFFVCSQFIDLATETPKCNTKRFLCSFVYLFFPFMIYFLLLLAQL